MTTVGSVVETNDISNSTPDDIARDWETWSRTLGILAIPRLEAIQDELPTITAAMLCTADGLNIAALGVPEDGIGRLAALSSSLFGVAGAHREILDPGPRDSTMVNIAGGHIQTVILRFEVAVVGPLLLVVAAEEVTLGSIVVAARSTAAELQGLLEPSET